MQIAKGESERELVGQRFSLCSRGGVLCHPEEREGAWIAVIIIQRNVWHGSAKFSGGSTRPSLSGLERPGCSVQPAGRGG